jgi:hypothetical protein
MASRIRLHSFDVIFGRSVRPTPLRASISMTVALACASCRSAPALTTADGAAGAGGAPADPVGEMTAASEFCERERNQEAAWRGRCLGGEAADWRGFLDTFTSCPHLDDLVAAGTVRYHAELAAACLDANRPDRDCRTAETLCFTHVIEGALDTGAPCQNDYQCPANAGCWASDEFGYNACLPSTCVHVPDKVGDACTQMPLPFCFTGLTCVHGVCLAHGSEGDPCGQDHPPCGWGLTCGAAAICVWRSDGGACQQDAQCISTQYCQDSQCQPRIAVGDSCASAPFGCAAFAACNSGVLCEPTGHLGQPCSNQVDAQYVCTAGFCRSNVCHEKLADGGDCYRGSDCVSQGCSIRCKQCSN